MISTDAPDGRRVQIGGFGRDGGSRAQRGRRRRRREGTEGGDCDKQMKLMTASVCLVKTGRSTVSGAMLNTPHMVK